MRCDRLRELGSSASIPPRSKPALTGTLTPEMAMGRQQRFYLYGYDPSLRPRLTFHFNAYIANPGPDTAVGADSNRTLAGASRPALGKSRFNRRVKSIEVFPCAGKASGLPRTCLRQRLLLRYTPWYMHGGGLGLGGELSDSGARPSGMSTLIASCSTAAREISSHFRASATAQVARYTLEFRLWGQGWGTRGRAFAAEDVQPCSSGGGRSLAACLVPREWARYRSKAHFASKSSTTLQTWDP